MDFKLYDTDWLLKKLKAGERLKYVYFWGHTSYPKGTVTKACLSQWWPSSFDVQGKRYFTAEHWMMAEKARLFGAEAIEKKILQVEEPGAAKALGRKVENFDPVVWDRKKYKIVLEGNFHKFSQNTELGTFLINTGQRVLVEASPVDAVWGIGLAADNPRCEDPSKWPGTNLLGYALMSARNLLEANTT